MWELLLVNCILMFVYCYARWLLINVNTYYNCIATCTKIVDVISFYVFFFFASILSNLILFSLLCRLKCRNQKNFAHLHFCIDWFLVIQQNAIRNNKNTKKILFFLLEVFFYKLWHKFILYIHSMNQRMNTTIWIEQQVTFKSTRH